LLRVALGVVRHAAAVAAYELDLAAGYRIAVLLHVELDCVVHLRRRVGELPRVRHDQADLDGLLREGRRRRERERAQGCCEWSIHDFLLWASTLARRVRRRKVGTRPTGGAYSGSILASRTISAYLRISAATKRLNSAGGSPTGSAPSASRRSRNV